mmetsp:Transcript_60567/g.169169  ORF Transcript_60567/g.169169 Transcript_60567/m.169169 type:complete len:394 (-) Transcript_60567:152-1333(-)
MEGQGKGPCRYGSVCTRKGCWYEHPAGHIVGVAEPVPCRYGVACTRRDCCFSHPPGRDASLTSISNSDLSQGSVPSGSDSRVCVWFQKGKCRNGSSCRYQHTQQERDGNIVVVRNLPKSGDPEALKDEIRLHFQAFGYLARILVKTDLSNRCRGFAFVVFTNVDSATSALQSVHPVWDITRKVDLPMYVEGDDRVSRKTGARVRTDAPLRLPFGLGDRVLLLGEGDFSYTAAAVRCGLLEPSQAWATSNEPPRDATYIEQLRRQGVQCLTDVDATSLALAETFDVVVFNFPHTGEPSIERNRDLLRAFFRSAQTVLRKGGRVAVALKQTWPYSDWDLENCAAQEGFRVVDAYGFPAAVLRSHGYTHSTTDHIPHQVDFLESASTFEFELDPCA